MSQSISLAKPGLCSVADARDAMLGVTKALGSEQAALEEALGRVLVEDLVASRDQPPFAVSAMDGYAIRSADAPGSLHVAGESAAGRGFEGRCEPGCAIRISTGAAIPDGADTIVIQEDVRRDGDSVTVPDSMPGRHVRPRGGDFAAGTKLLSAGRRLDGVAIALAAASGAATLAVVRAPRIAILATGDELAAPGTAPGRWQIFESGTYGLAGLIGAWGGRARRLAVERDDAHAIAHAAEHGLGESDLLVVVGGASVGDHDHARPALARLGLELLVEKVAVRPGKPTWFGITRLGPVLGLPGNPASALVCARLFLRPLIEAMLGRDPAESTMFRRAHLARALPANGPREHYLRAWLDLDADGRAVVRAHEDQDSSLISVFAAANALIRLPPGAPALAKGALVDVFALDSAC
ncbi:MAG TPA: gephyrin-like molybdotransferase Glp [Rhizomicrobium sp.]|nr:gephyrin-like molybdotransferase Glp [Rhizomicrobium sp.]